MVAIAHVAIRAGEVMVLEDVRHAVVWTDALHLLASDVLRLVVIAGQRS